MLLTTLLLAPAAFMQGHPPPPPPEGPRLLPPFLHMAEELGLSEAQSAQLKAILDGHRATLAPKTDLDRRAHERVMEAVRLGSGDLVALHASASAAHLAVLQVAQGIHAECLAVLTPAQREKAASLRPPRPGPGRERGEGRGEGRDEGRRRPEDGEGSSRPRSPRPTHPE